MESVSWGAAVNMMKGSGRREGVYSRASVAFDIALGVHMSISSRGFLLFLRTIISITFKHVVLGSSPV